MPVTCQHCGTEAPDDRVMCPNCRRRIRPAGEEAPAAATADTASDTRTEGADQPATAPGYAPAPPAPGGAPQAASAGGPPRPQVLFARAVTAKSNRLTVAFRIILAI